MNERRLTAFLHTRAWAVLLVLAAVVATVVAFDRVVIPPLTVTDGIGFTSAWLWFADSSVSLGVNLSLNIVIALGIVFINKRFNIMRSISYLSGGLYAVMVAALPAVACRFYGGTLLCLLVLLCTGLLFSIYGDPSMRRRVFLIFFILSLAAFAEYAFVFYVPVMVIGCLQMRILNLKTFLAAGIGLLTPPWILFGMGILSFDDITMPGFVSVFSAFDDPDMLPELVATGVTILAGLGFMTVNLIKMIAYNARTRGLNGFMTMVFIVTAVLAVVDFINFTVYYPLLTAMTAYQAAHFFSSRRYQRSYIGIFACVAVYCLIYSWCLLK